MAKRRLSKSFPFFILTQSLGAFNDNFFKMLLQLFVLSTLVAEQAEGIISLATFLFTLPFVIFGPWSGYIADKYAKTSVMRVVKIVEIGVMLVGALAFYLGNVNLMLFVMFLMATQSTFFSPAKYGYIPETSSPEAVTKANSWVEMSTFLSIILGTASVGLLLTYYDNNAFATTLYTVGIAVLGTTTVMFIKKIPAVGVNQPFPWNPITGIYRDISFLKKQKALFLAALANSYFWALGLLFQTNILIYGKHLLAGNENENILLSLLPAFMGIGIAAGSMLASRWSGRKVELGLVPLGGLGMAFAAIALFFTTSSYEMTAAILFLAGICGGLFIVPLYAYLQFYAKDNEKGRVLATAGILNGLFLVLGSLAYHILIVELRLPAATNYLIMGVLTVFAVSYIITVIPEYFVRFIFWLLTHTIYRIKIKGEEHIPFHGPALLISNHVSFVDAFLIASTMQRFIRFIMLKEYFDIPLIKGLFKLMHAIPIDPEAGHDSVHQSLMLAREQLEQNHVVCIFPEGKLTKDGKMNEFRTGFETVMEGLDCPIIPIYMENVWDTAFTYRKGKSTKRIAGIFPPAIIITFGEALSPDTKAPEAEAAVRKLSGEKIA